MSDDPTRRLWVLLIETVRSLPMAGAIAISEELERRYLRDEACTCGHSPEEHGHDPKYPGSTACTECDCVAYECCEDHDESGRACPNRD